jgi:methylated-DNA-[protein]-cysteine S-methyltransferase
VPYRTDFGTGWIVRDDDGELRRITLPGAADPAGEVGTAGYRDPLVEPLEKYYAGAASLLGSPQLVERAANTDLQRRIYSAVCAIRPGETRSYAAVAIAAGRPGAARAVGAAMARNPFPPFIPCHRVVGSNGDLRGYAGGIDMKSAMLAMESHG